MQVIPECADGWFLFDDNHAYPSRLASSCSVFSYLSLSLSLCFQRSFCTCGARERVRYPSSPDQSCWVDGWEPSTTREPIWDPGVFTIIIIFSPYWWLSYNKIFSLSLSRASQRQASFRSAPSSPSARRPSSCFDVDNEEVDVRANVDVADRHVRGDANDDVANEGDFLDSSEKSSALHSWSRLFSTLISLLARPTPTLTSVALPDCQSSKRQAIPRWFHNQRAQRQSLGRTSTKGCQFSSRQGGRPADSEECGHRGCQGRSAYRDRGPRLQGLCHDLDPGAQDCGQSRQDGVAGDCGLCSQTTQVGRHAVPEDSNRGC